MNSGSKAPIKVGVLGLGQLGGNVANALARAPEVALVAGGDQRENALAEFQEQFHGRAYASVERLGADPEVEAVWVCTPSALHCEHVVALAEHGKHVVVTKPMAMTLDECDRMIEAAKRNNVLLIYTGMAFSPPFLQMRRIIASGRLGRLGALTLWAFSDWMLRPRERHEVDVSADGGELFNQGPHPVDTLRLLGGGLVRSVRGATIDLALPERPCPGYFSAFLEFESGTPATFVYNGYGYVSGWELTAWGETPERRAAAADAYAFRKQLRSGSADDYGEKERSRFGGRDEGQDDFRARRATSGGGWVPSDGGLVIASCERGELRQSPNGLFVYDDDGRHDEAVAGGSSSRGEIAELMDGLAGRPIFRDGAWGKATLEVVLAIAQSGADRKEVFLKHQVPVPAI